jgi:hypothetical protein
MAAASVVLWVRRRWGEFQGSDPRVAVKKLKGVHPASKRAAPDSTETVSVASAGRFVVGPLRSSK